MAVGRGRPRGRGPGPPAPRLPRRPRVRRRGPGARLPAPPPDRRRHRRHARPRPRRRGGHGGDRRPGGVAHDPHGPAGPPGVGGADGHPAGHPVLRRRASRSSPSSGPRGTLQGLLAPLGVERLPSIGGLFGAGVVLILVTFPYVSLATRAALLRLDPAVEESARLLGDRRSTVFRRVTMPIVLPAIAAGALLAVLYALSDFGAVRCSSTTACRGPSTSSTARRSIDRWPRSWPSSSSSLTFVLTFGEARLRSRAGAFAAPSRRRPPAAVPLGRWRWPATAFLALVVGLALVVPIGTIAWWLVRGARRRASRCASSSTSRSIRSSSARRRRCWRSGWRSRSRCSPRAIAARLSSFVESAIYVGLRPAGHRRRPRRWSSSRRARVPPLYQTLALLVIVYAVRFMPQAVGGARVQRWSRRDPGWRRPAGRWAMGRSARSRC